MIPLLVKSVSGSHVGMTIFLLECFLKIGYNEDVSKQKRRKLLQPFLGHQCQEVMPKHETLVMTDKKNNKRLESTLKLSA